MSLRRNVRGQNVIKLNCMGQKVEKCRDTMYAFCEAKKHRRVKSIERKNIVSAEDARKIRTRVC